MKTFKNFLNEKNLKIFTTKEIKTKKFAKNVNKQMKTKILDVITTSGSTLKDYKRIIFGYIATILNMGVNIATQSTEKLNDDDITIFANNIRSIHFFKPLK